MLRRPRRGFTLVELMLATVTLSVISAALYQVLITSIRLSRAQASQFAVQSTARGAVLAISAELRELSGSDLLAVATGAVTYRAMRGTGFTCQPSTADRIHITRSGFTGHRDPQPVRDSLLVYVDSAGVGTGPAWVATSIAGIASATCPGGLGPGLVLTVPANDTLAGTPPGTPVRIYEVMELKQYQSEGKTWLGMRSVAAGEAIQPIFGPLHQTDGLQLEYLDATARQTWHPPSITGALVTLHGIADGDASSRLAVQVSLRNAQP